jgi:Uncharacterized conserved protein (COG2071)
MKLRTVVRDCLFLNWALPAASLPAPPAPLRYQLHDWQGVEHVFASALLFHHDAVRWQALPLVRIGYPQLNVRLYVLDGDGVPAVLFLRELMPGWVAPGVRLISRHPAASARLDFPRPSRHPGDGSWLWRVRRGDSMTVRAALHSPMVGQGPQVGGWDETVRYFQDRPRGYAQHAGSLHRTYAAHPPSQAVWPLAAAVEQGDALLRRLLPIAPDAAMPALHSSWLCPEMPFAIALDLMPRVQPVVNGMPHPAAGRVTVGALRARAAGRRAAQGEAAAGGAAAAVAAALSCAAQGGAEDGAPAERAARLPGTVGGGGGIGGVGAMGGGGVAGAAGAGAVLASAA